jgi:hypothetical protein
MSDTPAQVPPSRKGPVVLTVLLTLACVFIFEKLLILTPPNSSQERAKRSEALLAAQEKRSKEYEEFLNGAIEDHRRWHELLIQEEKDNERFEDILDKWEQQQKAYQAYLDSLKHPQ